MKKKMSVLSTAYHFFPWDIIVAYMPAYMYMYLLNDKVLNHSQYNKYF